MATTTARIPILIPRLPSAQSLLLYLQEIDAARYYSNGGPLVRRLELRLGRHFGFGEGNVALAANATLGLTVALMAQGARPGSLCITPAWTHIATVQAIRLAGLIPYFVDVAAETWGLDPASAPAAVREAPGEVGAIIVVSPFGRPVDYAAWDGFHDSTGLPVVIDAAAGFDTLVPSRVPAVVSLHATKVFGIGEGGFVASTDGALMRDVRSRVNLGFAGGRVEEVAGLNAKLSEYHAAVGHASLDEWDAVRAEWMAAAATYRRCLADVPGAQLQPGFGRTWVSSTCVVDVVGGDSAVYIAALAQAGIEARRWWEMGAHRHPTTLALPRTLLPVTDAVARTSLGLPIYRDITPEQIERVVEVIRQVRL